MHGSAPRTLRRWVLRGLLVCLVMLVFGLGLGWLLLHRVPGWYQPVYVPESQLNRVRAEAADLYNAISAGIVHGSEFELTLHEDEVSQWVGAANRLWPGAAELFPPWVEDPVVRFSEQGITVGARLYREGKELIVGVRLALDTAPDLVTLRMTRLTGGSLPVPVSWLAGPTAGLLSMDGEGLDQLPGPIADLLCKLRESEPLQLLTQGVSRANRFIWDNGRRPFTVKAVRVEAGKMALIIDPL